MPKNRRQQKKERREAKRKAKRKDIRKRTTPSGKRSMLKASLQWPVLECWINEDWRDPTALNQVVVARGNPASGEVFVGIYLLDRACLGIKDAHVANFFDAGEYRREILERIAQTQDIIQIDINLAAAIVKAAREYAATLGFSPHKDYHDAAILLEDADPDAVTETIPVGGPEGKPFFVSGPFDNAQKIIATLERTVGPGNYDYMAGISDEDIDDLEVIMDEDADILDADDFLEDENIVEGNFTIEQTDDEETPDNPKTA